MVSTQSLPSSMMPFIVSTPKAPATNTTPPTRIPVRARRGRERTSRRSSRTITSANGAPSSTQLKPTSIPSIALILSAWPWSRSCAAMNSSNEAPIATAPSRIQENRCAGREATARAARTPNVSHRLEAYQVARFASCPVSKAQYTRSEISKITPLDDRWTIRAIRAISVMPTDPIRNGAVVRRRERWR